MKLGTKAHYAVSALVDMTIHGEKKALSIGEISLRQGLSPAYLEQIFVKLRRKGLVKSVRGQHGGYLLNYAPESLPIAEIVRAVEETVRITQCRPGEHKGCRGKSARCLTHDLWEDLGTQIMSYLENVSLNDVAAPYFTQASKDGEK